MTNNTAIRLATLAVIAFCFLAMILTASLSVRADVRPGDAGLNPVAVSAAAEYPETQLNALSFADTGAGEEIPSL